MSSTATSIQEEDSNGSSKGKRVCPSRSGSQPAREKNLWKAAQCIWPPMRAATSASVTQHPAEGSQGRSQPTTRRMKRTNVGAVK